MTLAKIVAIIVALWMIFKVRSFIKSIDVKYGKSVGNHKKKNRKANMDIQDADYEDVE